MQKDCIMCSWHIAFILRISCSNSLSISLSYFVGDKIINQSMRETKNTSKPPNKFKLSICRWIRLGGYALEFEDHFLLNSIHSVNLLE